MHGRSREAGGVHHRTGSHRDAAGVDQHDVAVGDQRAQNAGRVGATTRLMLVLPALGWLNQAVLPAGTLICQLMAGMAGARCVLGGDHQLVALLLQAGLTGNGLCARGLGLQAGCGRCKASATIHASVRSLKPWAAGEVR